MFFHEKGFIWGDGDFLRIRSSILKFLSDSTAIFVMSSAFFLAHNGFLSQKKAAIAISAVGIFNSLLNLVDTLCITYYRRVKKIHLFTPICHLIFWGSQVTQLSMKYGFLGTSETLKKICFGLTAVSTLPWIVAATVRSRDESHCTGATDTVRGIVRVLPFDKFSGINCFNQFLSPWLVKSFVIVPTALISLSGLGLSFFSFTWILYKWKNDLQTYLCALGAGIVVGLSSLAGYLAFNISKFPNFYEFEIENIPWGRTFLSFVFLSGILAGGTGAFYCVERAVFNRKRILMQKKDE